MLSRQGEIIAQSGSLNGHGLSLHVSEVAQGLAEYSKVRLLGGGEFRGAQDAEAWHLPRLLRLAAITGEALLCLQAAPVFGFGLFLMHRLAGDIVCSGMLWGLS